MARAPYPLEAAETLRAQARDEAVLELRAAQDALCAAEAALAGLHEALGQAKAARERFARERPVHGDGASLQREAHYATRLQREAEAAAGAVRAGEATLRARRAELAAAQDRLARAEADRALLARDHARHDGQQQRRLERAEELEQEESPLARQPRPAR